MLETQLDLLDDSAPSTLAHLHSDLRSVAAIVADIAASLPMQRRPAPDWAKALHARVTWMRPNGFCPCCQVIPVCDVGGRLPGTEIDHFFGRHRNDVAVVWLVCRNCNRELEHPSFKSERRSEFEAYQRAVEPFREDTNQRGLF
jgi:hypothetical protein